MFMYVYISPFWGRIGTRGYIYIYSLHGFRHEDGEFSGKSVEGVELHALCAILEGGGQAYCDISSL